MAAFSTAMALVTKEINSFAAIINGINLPILLLAGVLLPISIGPLWMRVLAHFNPLYYAVEASGVRLPRAASRSGGLAGVRGARAAVRTRSDLGDPGVQKGGRREDFVRAQSFPTMTSVALMTAFTASPSVRLEVLGRVLGDRGHDFLAALRRMTTVT